MTKTIKVVRFGVNEGDVGIMEIDNTLKMFQELVEGYIETTSFDGLRQKGIIIVCNEEGLLKGLDPNENVYPFFIVGNVIFTSYNNEGDFVSLTDEQVEYIGGYFPNAHF